MLTTTVSGANPTWNQALSTNDWIQLANAHYLQPFAFTDGTHYSVVVFNLSRSGSLPVTFSRTNAPSGTVLISQFTSTNPTDNNEGLTSSTPVVNAPTQTSVANSNPATSYSLPPYSMTVFLWPEPGALREHDHAPSISNLSQHRPKRHTDSDCQLSNKYEYSDWNRHLPERIHHPGHSNAELEWCSYLQHHLFCPSDRSRSQLLMAATPMTALLLPSRLPSLSLLVSSSRARRSPLQQLLLLRGRA